MAAAISTVFFTKRSAAGPCSSEVFGTAVTGGDAKPTASLNGLVSVWAISPDGEELAYVHASCAPKAAPVLSLQDLRSTTEVDIIESPYSGAVQLAWARGDQDLAISAPAPPDGAPRLFVLHSPFQNPPTSATSIACPSDESRCEQLAPAYDVAGHLMYLVDTPPLHGGCLAAAACGPRKYTVTYVDGQTSVPLVSVSAPWHSATPSVPSLSADRIAGHFLVTVSASNAFIATYLCAPHGPVTRLPSAVLEAQWSS